MVYRLLIDGLHPEEVRVALTNEGYLEEFEVETSQKKQIKSNIYLGKVTRVEPSLQAAFVEYGGNRQGFLPFSELHFDYYQIPVEDKEDLKASLERGAEDADFVEDQDEPISNEADEADKIIAESTAKSAVKDESDVPSDEAESSTDSDAGVELEQPVDGDSEDDADVADVRRTRNQFYRKYKIQEVLKRNQLVLVQIIKEERGNKGASLTTYISLPGRYCVLMPNTESSGGVSRRITDSSQRKRLKGLISSFELDEGNSVIVRTAGVDQSDADIKADYEYLHSLWEGIRNKAVHSSAPALVYEEGDLVQRSLRDIYRSHVNEVLVQGTAAFASAKEVMAMLSPEQSDRIVEYSGNVTLFQKYGVEAQLNALYQMEVPLASGGSIVLAPTEALVSVDVNSGKSTKERNIEETAFNTNIEAAQEVARQLRLRDLAGLVVIDFIDMRELKNRRGVERALKEALKKDRAKIQVGALVHLACLKCLANDCGAQF